MHAVVTLLDEQHTQIVNDLWRELARDFSMRRLADILPYPHFSYQIAQRYDEQQLVERISALARRIEPFNVGAGGLALFTGAHPVLYIPVVRTFALSQFHRLVCQTITPAGSGIPAYYEEANWVPHITLAEHDIEGERLGRALARLYTRDLNWEIPVDNLAVIWDTGTQQEVRYRFALGEKS